MPYTLSMSKSTITRIGLAFKDDDLRRIKRIQAHLRPTLGDIKRNAVIRMALIAYESTIPKPVK